MLGLTGRAYSQVEERVSRHPRQSHVSCQDSLPGLSCYLLHTNAQYMYKPLRVSQNKTPPTTWFRRALTVLETKLCFRFKLGVELVKSGIEISTVKVKIVLTLFSNTT